MSKVEKDKPIQKKIKLKDFIQLYIRKLKLKCQQLDFKIAIKITVTALLSLYICLGLDTYLKHPQYLAAGLWCVVASIVVLQTNIGGTYKAIWNRFIGVLIGSSLGAFFAFTFGAEAEVLGIAIFITIILCSFLGIQDSYRMASLSVAIIMIPWKLHPTSDPWIDAFFRFLDTCLGFAIAILVSHILWPSQALTTMRVNMGTIFNLLRHYFENLLIPTDSLNKSFQTTQSLLNEIDEAFLKNRAILEESKIELLVKFDSIGVWLDLINYQDRLWESFRALQNVFSSNLEEIFDEGLKHQVQHIVQMIDSALKELSVKLQTNSTNFDFIILSKLQTSLYAELVRFRSTQAIKRYHLDLVEDYFVFFYHLKQILNILFQINQSINHLYTSELKS